MLVGAKQLELTLIINMQLENQLDNSNSWLVKLGDKTYLRLVSLPRHLMLKYEKLE